MGPMSPGTDLSERFLDMVARQDAERTCPSSHQVGSSARTGKFDVLSGSHVQGLLGQASLTTLWSCWSKQIAAAVRSCRSSNRKFQSRLLAVKMMMEGILVTRTLIKAVEIIGGQSCGNLTEISGHWMCFLRDLDDCGSIPEESEIDQKHWWKISWALWGSQGSYRMIKEVQWFR